MKVGLIFQLETISLWILQILYAHSILLVINTPSPYSVTRSYALKLARNPVLPFLGCHTPRFDGLILSCWVCLKKWVQHWYSQK